MRRKNKGLSEPDINGTGSPKLGEPVYLTVGRLGKPHGLDGGVVFYIITDFPERLIKGKKVYIGDEKIEVHIKSVRDHHRGMIFHFEEYSTIDEIEKFKSQFLYVDSIELPQLPDGEYYHHQLIGLNVLDLDSKKIGVIIKILETGANDVYLIKNEENKEILFPALLKLIKKIDLENQLMVIKPLEYYNQD